MEDQFKESRVGINHRATPFFVFHSRNKTVPSYTRHTPESMSLRRICRLPIGVAYHELQSEGRCAMHACNNVVGEAAFPYDQFVTAATELMHPNVAGWWNGEVIQAIFERSEDWSALRCLTSGAFPARYRFFATLQGFVGFVVARPNHWIALRLRTPQSSDLSFEVADSQLDHLIPLDYGAAYDWLRGSESRHVFAVWRTALSPVQVVRIGLREATRTDTATGKQRC